MKENKTKPDIRFKGFTDDWEQRKLDEVAFYRNGKAHEGCIDDKGSYVVVNSKFVSTDGKIRKYSKDQIEPLFKNEIAFVLSDVPNGRAISKTFLVDESNKYTLNQRVAGITPFKETYPYFLHILMNRNKYYLLFDDGVKQTNLTVSDVLKFETKYPSYKEQTKIGQYFSQLDNLITLHQRECNQLKELKKTMLKKMFPRDGSNIPEVRFAGFTDDWEQRKLGELLEKYEDPVETPHDGYERLGIRSHAKGTFHSFVESGEELNSARMHRVAANKFILNITFAWEHAVAITDKNDEGKLVSHRFPQFSFDKCLKSNFFKYLILDEKFRKHLELSSPGGAGRNRVLKISDMLEYKIYLPSIDEQTEIGQYFSHLDNLITLHQRELEILKNLKKTCLKRMFI